MATVPCVPQPHDLIWGHVPAEALANAPAWVAPVLAAGRPVVVRRGEALEGFITIGVRGWGRAQRFAAHLRLDSITRCISPEQIRAAAGRSVYPAFNALAALTPCLDEMGFAWGPTGGVAYQRVTGLEVLHPGSDLDLLIRMPEPLVRARALAIFRQFDRFDCGVDAQLETPCGAVALREWAGASRRVLLKRQGGAKLVIDPWDPLEAFG